MKEYGSWRDASFVDIYYLSKRTGLSIAWLKRESRAGSIPCICVGRSLLFNLEQVEQCLIVRAERDAKALRNLKLKEELAQDEPA